MITAFDPDHGVVLTSFGPSFVYDRRANSWVGCREDRRAAPARPSPTIRATRCSSCSEDRSSTRRGRSIPSRARGPRSGPRCRLPSGWARTSRSIPSTGSPCSWAARTRIPTRTSATPGCTMRPASEWKDLNIVAPPETNPGAGNYLTYDTEHQVFLLKHGSDLNKVYAFRYVPSEGTPAAPPSAPRTETPAQAPAVLASSSPAAEAAPRPDPPGPKEERPASAPAAAPLPVSASAGTSAGPPAALAATGPGAIAGSAAATGGRPGRGSLKRSGRHAGRRSGRDLRRWSDLHPLAHLGRSRAARARQGPVPALAWMQARPHGREPAERPNLLRGRRLRGAHRRRVVPERDVLLQRAARRLGPGVPVLRPRWRHPARPAGRGWLGLGFAAQRLLDGTGLSRVTPDPHPAPPSPTAPPLPCPTLCCHSSPPSLSTPDETGQWKDFS